VEVVARDNPGGKKNVIFNNCKLSDINMAVDFHIVSHFASVIDNGMAPYTNIIADFIFFPYDDIVPGIKIIPDRGTLVDNGTASYNGIFPDS
jgi:hypothetical protein